LVTPIALVLAFFFYFRGHNAPGGGFIGGLVVAIALVLYSIAFDLDGARKLMPMTLERMFSLGLALAAITGFAAMLFDKPFLTSGQTHASFGPMGEFHLVSAALFDLGVFFVVIAVVAGMVFQLALRRCIVLWPAPEEEAALIERERPRGPLLSSLFAILIDAEERPSIPSEPPTDAPLSAKLRVEPDPQAARESIVGLPAALAKARKTGLPGNLPVAQTARPPRKVDPEA